MVLGFGSVFYHYVVSVSFLPTELSDNFVFGLLSNVVVT